jgi:hypothetical protein
MQLEKFLVFILEYYVLNNNIPERGTDPRACEVEAEGKCGRSPPFVITELKEQAKRTKEEDYAECRIL